MVDGRWLVVDGWWSMAEAWSTWRGTPRRVEAEGCSMTGGAHAEVADCCWAKVRLARNEVEGTWAWWWSSQWGANRWSGLLYRPCGWKCRGSRNTTRHGSENGRGTRTWDEQRERQWRDHRWPKSTECTQVWKETLGVLVENVSCDVQDFGLLVVTVGTSITWTCRNAWLGSEDCVIEVSCSW